MTPLPVSLSLLNGGNAGDPKAMLPWLQIRPRPFSSSANTNIVSLSPTPER